MSLTVTDGVAFVHVQGEVDLANAEQLQAIGEDAISDYIGTIRIDLYEVTFIDSTGLAALVAIYKHADETGRILILERPSTRVMKILEITGLTDMFAIDANPQAGVTKISDKQGQRPGLRLPTSQLG